MIISVSIPQFSFVIFIDSFNIHLLNTIMCQVLIYTPNDKLVDELEEDNIHIITIVVIIAIIAVGNIFSTIIMYFLLCCYSHFILPTFLNLYHSAINTILWMENPKFSNLQQIFQQQMSLP